MTDPADLNRLREALKWTTPVRDDLSSNSQRFLLDIYIDAARAYLDLMENGERVWWCPEHGAKGMSDNENWCVYAEALWDHDGTVTANPCFMVSVRLVPEEPAK